MSAHESWLIYKLPESIDQGNSHGFVKIQIIWSCRFCDGHCTSKFWKIRKIQKWACSQSPLVTIVHSVMTHQGYKNMKPSAESQLDKKIVSFNRRKIWFEKFEKFWRESGVNFWSPKKLIEKYFYNLWLSSEDKLTQILPSWFLIGFKLF